MRRRVGVWRLVRTTTPPWLTTSMTLQLISMSLVGATHSTLQLATSGSLLNHPLLAMVSYITNLLLASSSCKHAHINNHNHKISIQTPGTVVHRLHTLLSLCAPLLFSPLCSVLSGVQLCTV